MEKLIFIHIALHITYCGLKKLEAIDKEELINLLKNFKRHIMLSLCLKYRKKNTESKQLTKIIKKNKTFMKMGSVW